MGKNDFFKDLPRRGAKHLLATMAWAAFCTGTVYAQEWIDVTDTYITNADFSTGTTDGWDAGTALPGVNATWLNAEFFQSYNSASQNVLGLKAGHYKLTVQGFHRAGGNDNGAAYNAGTEVMARRYGRVERLADQISRKLSERGDIHRTTRRKRHADGDCIQYQCG